MEWNDPLTEVSGIGPVRQKLLESQGINTVKDLLCYLPYRYEDSSDVLTVTELYKKLGLLPLWELPREKFSVKAVLLRMSTFRSKRGFFIIKAVFGEAGTSETIDAVWFNQEFLTNQLQEREHFLLFGKVTKDGRKLVLQSPKIEHVVEEQRKGKTLGTVMPLYRRIKTIRSAHIKGWMKSVLPTVTLHDYLSYDLQKKYQLPDIAKAFTSVHRPHTVLEAEEGQRRLAIQELIELKRRFDKVKKVVASDYSGESLAKDISKIVGECIKKLPFDLTKGQEHAVDQLLQTIAAGKRIDTFIYGDVGSGKTIVVLLLAQAFARLGHSTIFAVPTTILASQHVKTAEKLGIPVQLITAKQKVKTIDNTPTIYIGTHALLSSPVTALDSIALVIIDEQHRFGVMQREALTSKRGRHVIMLSATPIPRTLALSFLGFSDSLSILERPVGRKEIITRVVPSGKDDATYQWIVQHIMKGEQAYIVFPRIEEEDENEKQSLLSMAEVLKESFFNDIPSALLYGSMKEEEKISVMENFASGKTKILFATSVIEVGVDVPNATIIAIHGAEMFGLAQLHQLRGRVGRSSQQGYCFLFSGSTIEDAMTRLEYFSSHNSGIDVAEYDLKNRGAGQLLGTGQAGLSELRIASVDRLDHVQDAMELYEEVKKQRLEFPEYILV